MMDDPAREPTWQEMATWGRQEMRDTMYSRVSDERAAEIEANLAACDAEVGWVGQPMTGARR